MMTINRSLILGWVAGGLATLAFLGCSHNKPKNQPDSVSPQAIQIRGCGVNVGFQPRPRETVLISDLLKRVEPLPASVNGVFIRTPKGEYFYWLNQVTNNDAAGRFPVSTRDSILLVHRTDSGPSLNSN